MRRRKNKKYLYFSVTSQLEINSTVHPDELCSSPILNFTLQFLPPSFFSSSSSSSYCWVCCQSVLLQVLVCPLSLKLHSLLLKLQVSSQRKADCLVSPLGRCDGVKSKSQPTHLKTLQETSAVLLLRETLK